MIGVTDNKERFAGNISTDTFPIRQVGMHAYKIISDNRRIDAVLTAPIDISNIIARACISNDNAAFYIDSQNQNNTYTPCIIGEEYVKNPKKRRAHLMIPPNRDGIYERLLCPGLIVPDLRIFKTFNKEEARKTYMAHSEFARMDCYIFEDAEKLADIASVKEHTYQGIIVRVPDDGCPFVILKKRINSNSESFYNRQKLKEIFFDANNPKYWWNSL